MTGAQIRLVAPEVGQALAVAQVAVAGHVLGQDRLAAGQHLVADVLARRACSSAMLGSRWRWAVTSSSAATARCAGPRCRRGRQDGADLGRGSPPAGRRGRCGTAPRRSAAEPMSRASRYSSDRSRLRLCRGRRRRRLGRRRPPGGGGVRKRVWPRRFLIDMPPSASASPARRQVGQLVHVLDEDAGACGRGGPRRRGDSSHSPSMRSPLTRVPLRLSRSRTRQRPSAKVDLGVLAAAQVVLEDDAVGGGPAQGVALRRGRAGTRRRSRRRGGRPDRLSCRWPWDRPALDANPRRTNLSDAVCHDRAKCASRVHSPCVQSRR